MSSLPLEHAFCICQRAQNTLCGPRDLPVDCLSSEDEDRDLPCQQARLLEPIRTRVWRARCHDLENTTSRRAPLRIDALCPADDLGKFTNEAGPELEGLAVQGDGTAKVLEMLSEKGSLIHEHNYLHKYPYDWRSKKPVILRATSQWFANVGSIKEDALKAIEGVRILPDNARGRLNAFVQSRSEWCISRQRSWGVPIPVMYDTETDEPLLTDASVGHIIDVVKQHGTDAWWSMSTEELLAPEYRNNGRTYRRGYDTMDVWFDSGTSWTMIEEKMPRPHLPYVADVYSEGSDQHRGWFQSSLLTSVALTGKAPYATLITHGFLLDAKGFKQSKSVGNTVEPSIVIFGGKVRADVLA